MNKTLKLFFLLSVCLYRFSFASHREPATGIPNIVYILIPKNRPPIHTFLDVPCMGNDEKNAFIKDNPDFENNLDLIKISTRNKQDKFYKKNDPIKQASVYYCSSLAISPSDK